MPLQVPDLPIVDALPPRVPPSHAAEREPHLHEHVLYLVDSPQRRPAAQDVDSAADGDVVDEVEAPGQQRELPAARRCPVDPAGFPSVESHVGADGALFRPGFAGQGAVEVEVSHWCGRGRGRGLVEGVEGGGGELTDA